MGPNVLQKTPRRVKERKWGGQRWLHGGLRCCWEKASEVHLQVEGWGSLASSGVHIPSLLHPDTVLIVEGGWGLEMGKMRLKVSLFGDLRKEWSLVCIQRNTGKGIAVKMQKTRGLQIIQMYYCKACKLPWINSQEGRTSILSLTSPSPAPFLRSFLSISSCPPQFWVCFSLSCPIFPF